MAKMTLLTRQLDMSIVAMGDGRLANQRTSFAPKSTFRNATRPALCARTRQQVSATTTGREDAWSRGRVEARVEETVWSSAVLTAVVNCGVLVPWAQAAEASSSGLTNLIYSLFAGFTVLTVTGVILYTTRNE